MYFAVEGGEYEIARPGRSGESCAWAEAKDTTARRLMIERGMTR